jgi:hypothetical protein
MIISSDEALFKSVIRLGFIVLPMAFLLVWQFVLKKKTKSTQPTNKMALLRIQLAVQTGIVAIPIALLIENNFAALFCVAFMAFTFNVTIPVLVKKLFSDK